MNITRHNTINKLETLELQKDYTVIDIETTGLSCEKNEIIELSAIRIRNNKIIKEFSSLVKPQGKINYFIKQLTGISNEMVKTAPSIAKVLPEFMNFISTDTLIGHNIKFDLRFISHNLQIYTPQKLNNSKIDTMQLSRKYLPELTNHKLQTLAEHFNINTKGHHRALTDCIITHSVYQNIKQLSQPAYSEI